MKHGIDICFEKRYTGGSVIRVKDYTSLDASSITVLFGASGSGKTTVLRCLAGLERPDVGHIRFSGEVWSDAASGIFLPPRLRGNGLVQQNYALFPHLSVSGNVGYGLSGMDASARRKRIGETLDLLELVGMENRLPRELSGGQQQRVALARALAPRPRLLLLDEPLSSLDHPTRTRLRVELRDLLLAAKVPAILVTHDRQEAAVLGDEIIVMDNGNMIQHGTIKEVFSRPISSDVADIFAVETILPGEILAIKDGISTVQINGIPLQAIAEGLPTETKNVFVCIRAEDVSLAVTGGHAASPRNRLLSRVTGISREGPLARIELDCGFHLSALLTPQGIEELALTVGCSVVASIKAPKIHLIPR